MSLVIEGFGDTDLIVTLGLGDESDATVSGIVPKGGTIRGGTAFTLVTDGVTNADFADTFPDVTLSPKWDDISSGGGSIIVNNGLFLNITTAGGVAGIATNGVFTNFDVSANFSYNRTIESFFPANNIIFLQIVAYLSSTNYFTLGHIWDPARGSVLDVSVTIDGVTTKLFSNFVNSSSRILRLVRFNGHLQAYVGDILLTEYFGWIDDDVKVHLVSSSNGTPIPLQTTVTEFNPNLLVTFGDAIALSVFSRANRIIGVSPPFPVPEGVEVIVHMVQQSISLGAESWLYTAPLQLTISNGGNAIVINNDDTLRDTSSTLKGLRI